MPSVGYRDETETLKARVAELEARLEESEDTVARLLGTAPAGSSPTEIVEPPSRVLDGPSAITLTRELDVELDDEGLEAIAAFLRTRDGADVRQVGRSLHAPGFSLEQRGGKARVSMTADYRGFALGAASLATLGGGFTAFAAFAIAHDAFARSLAEWHILWLAPLFIAMAFVFARRLASGRARDAATKRKASFEGVVELAKRHGAKPAAKVRVEPEEEAAEAEAEVPAASEPQKASRQIS